MIVMAAAVVMSIIGGAGLLFAGFGEIEIMGYQLGPWTRLGVAGASLAMTIWSLELWRLAA